MKKIFLLCIFMFLTLHCSYASYVSDVTAYIQKYQGYALETQRRYGIPASITLAQGILESGAGKSRLTLQSHNHFGVKGKGTVGSVKAKDDEPGLSTFRAYRNDQESYDDHARVLRANRYWKDLKHVSIYDYRSWARIIKANGYATAPDYAEALIGLIDRFQLYKVNNGRKLRANKRLVVVGYREIVVSSGKRDSVPTFENEAEVVLDDDEMSDEENELEKCIENYPTDLVINDVPCTVMMPGKELNTICRDYCIDNPEDVLRYNEVNSESQLKEGCIVYLDKKKAKYEGSRDVYNVRSGETLYDISQRFAIQVQKLAKMNHIENVHALLPKGMAIELK